MKKPGLTYIFLFCIIIANVQAQSVREQKEDAYGYLWAENYEAAKPVFDKLITSSPANADYLLGRGIVKYHLNQYEDALSDFEKAADYGNAEAFLWKARSYARQQHIGETAKSIETYLREIPGADWRAVRKDPAFKFMYTSDEWLLLWEDQSEDELEGIEAEVRYYISRKNYQMAHQHIEEKLQEGQKDIILYKLNAEAYEKEGNVQLALNELNYALSIVADDQELLLKKADYLVLLNETEKAYKLINKIAEYDYLDFDCKLKRAELGLQCGYLVQAEKDIQLIRKYSNLPEHALLSGKIAYENGNYLETLKTLNALLEDDEANSEYLKVRGMTYYQTRTYKQAAYDLSMSLDLKPDDPETNYFKALSENALGDKSMACYYMERAAKKAYLPAQEFLQNSCNSKEY